MMLDQRIGAFGCRLVPLSLTGISGTPSWA
jgi:hypothetical protein